MTPNTLSLKSPNDSSRTIILQKIQEIEANTDVDGFFVSKNVVEITHLLQEACDLLIELQTLDLDKSDHSIDSLQLTLSRKTEKGLVKKQSPDEIKLLADKAKIAFSKYLSIF
ncbi:MAG: hypothetical protein V4489_08755 [Chlamydiota bacterium]